MSRARALLALGSARRVRRVGRGRIAMAESAAAAAAGDGKVEKAANGGVNGCDAAGEGKKRADQAVAFHELFTFADKWDLVLMAAGSLGALAHGAAMPLFFLLFGDLINGFGKNQTDLRTMTDEVSKVRALHSFTTPTYQTYLRDLSNHF